MNFEKLTRTQKQKTGQLMQKLGQSLAQVPEHLKEQLEKEARMLNLVDYLIQIQDGILARVGSRTKG